MDKKRTGLDPDFIAKPGKPPEPKKPAPVNAAALERRPAKALQKGPIKGLPDLLDETRIKFELQQVAGTPGFKKLVVLLRGKYHRAAERQALEQWISLYDTSKRTVQAHTELVRAQHDHAQLEREYVIKEKEKDAKVATLDAEIIEQRLRKKRAHLAMQQLEASAKMAPDADQKTDDADPAIIDRWYKQSRQAVTNDDSLTAEQQDQMLADLKREYDRRRHNVYVDADFETVG
jgi:hypothetical protein